MRKEDTITLNNHTITVKELTVAEVRHWMMDMMAEGKQKKPNDAVSLVLDQGLFADIGLSDIVRMTDLKHPQLDTFAPSELQMVIEKCKELNPDFFGLRGRLMNLTSKSA